MDRVPTAYLLPSSDSESSIRPASLPRISLNLREHKTPLAVTAAVLITTNGILPLVLYYALKYGANTSDNIAITVAGVVLSPTSLYSLCDRTWSLSKKDSTTRPLGAGRWSFDYFHINFAFLFCVLVVVISVGTTLAGSDNAATRANSLRILAMSLPVIMTWTCSQLVIMSITMSLTSRARYPFRFSSMAKNDPVRPALFTIAEDIVAVDGKQGTHFRRQLDQRYRFSKDIRALFRWADAVWGVSGVTVGIALIVVIWVVKDAQVGFSLSFSIPWIWAAFFTWLTIQRTKSATQDENIRYKMETSFVTTP